MDRVRSPQEVARRALALFSIVGLAFKADRGEVMRWLGENDLRDELTPWERAFVDTPEPSRQQVIYASWFSERLFMLLWALGRVDALPAADEQCDSAIFQRTLPPFTDETAAEFVARAELRAGSDLIAMADETLTLHWSARDARSNDRAPAKPVDIEVIQERHHAINWVIGYDGLPWDEVTTDT